MANRFNNLPWYHMPEWGEIAYYTPALCGSQTLMRFILAELGLEDPGFGKRRALVHEQKGVVQWYQYPPIHLHRVGFVRDPAERFNSLLKNLYSGSSFKVPYQLRDYTPLQVFKHILLRLEENMHWIPQAHGLQGASAIHRLEDMSEVLGTPIHEHQTHGYVSVDDELRNAIEEMYSLDCRLYDE